MEYESFFIIPMILYTLLWIFVVFFLVLVLIVFLLIYFEPPWRLSECIPELNCELRRSFVETFDRNFGDVYSSVYVFERNRFSTGVRFICTIKSRKQRVFVSFHTQLENGDPGLVYAIHFPKAGPDLPFRIIIGVCNDLSKDLAIEMAEEAARCARYIADHNTINGLEKERFHANYIVHPKKDHVFWYTGLLVFEREEVVI